ncbi:MAG: hypothetical protein WBL20_19190 [Sphingobium sp.]|uniref:hypothetical protein n=1 Tax=Sphingobium sp. TaxID=1912891 RepID=UPI002E2073C8
MMKTAGSTIVAAWLAIAPAQAQYVYHFAAPESPVVSTQRFVLPAGTPLRLRTTTQISSKDNLPGDRIHLEVAEPVYFRDQVVIPAGAPVIAEVTSTQRNGHFGKKGKIALRLVEAMTPHGPVRLTGASYDEGKSGTVASIGTMLFVTSLGFLIHGTSAYIPAGTLVDGQLNGDLRFRYAPALAATPAYGGAEQAAPVASGLGR